MATKRRRQPGANDANRETLAGYIAHIVMYEHGITPLDLERAYHLSPEEARAALADQYAYFGTGGKGYGAFFTHVKKAIAKKAWFEAPDPKAIPGAARAYGRYAWLLENSDAPGTDQGRKDASDIEDLQRSLNNVGFNGWGLALDNWPEALSYYNAAPSVYRPHAHNEIEETREAPTMQAHRQPADEHAATELVMFIENESDLSPDGPSGQGRSVLLNALRKWKKGTYDPKLAVKLFEYLAEAGARRYAKEFPGVVFNPATRHEAAKQLEASFRNSAENGEYDHIDTRTGVGEHVEEHVDARGKTRLDKLRAELPPGYAIYTYSPGDGVTRYRFFENAPPGQDYFGPNNGIYTALGYAEAETFASGLATQRDPRGASYRRANEVHSDRKHSMTYGTVPSFKEFERDVHTRIDPEGSDGSVYWPPGTLYPMELVSSREIELAQEFGELEEFRGAHGKQGFRGNERQIYDFVKFLMDQEDAYSGEEGSPGDLASSIMYTLGYEWV